MKPIRVAAAVAASVLVAGCGASKPAPRLAFSDPAWSRSGSEIALAGRRPSGQYALFVMNADGSGMRQVGPYTLFLRWPTWSKDDRWIAYSKGNGGIWKVAAKGGTPTRVARFGVEPSWSTDGRTIAFAWGGETEGQRLYAVAPDGSRLHVVAKPSVYLSFQSPSWSPAGVRLVVAVWPAPDSANAPGSLRVVPAHGGRMATVFSGHNSVQPAWSPRGNDIAFSRNDREISVLNLTSGAVTYLHPGRSPTWSPQGTKIAFERAGIIYAMNRDGSNVKRLTPLRRSG